MNGGDFMLTVLFYAGIFLGGFVTGILVGRNNPAKTEKVINKIKEWEKTNF